MIFKSNDKAWLVAETLIWAIIEVNTGLILACVPVLRPFFREVIESNSPGTSWSLARGKFSPRVEKGRDVGEQSDRMYLQLENWNQIDQPPPAAFKAPEPELSLCRALYGGSIMEPDTMSISKTL